MESKKPQRASRKETPSQQPEGITLDNNFNKLRKSLILKVSRMVSNPVNTLWVRETEIVNGRYSNLLSLYYGGNGRLTIW